MIRYNGYEMGPVEIDAEDGALTSTVAGLKDLIYFEASTGLGLLQAFRDSVDDYLALCARRGIEPDQPCRTP
jgi:predicted HicB family RNase H-like nuclease